MLPEHICFQPKYQSQNIVSACCDNSIIFMVMNMQSQHFKLEKDNVLGVIQKNLQLLNITTVFTNLVVVVVV